MKIRLMTSNIWGDFFGNPVGPRAPLLAKIFARYAPDILGMQEVGPSWWASPLIPELRKVYAQVPAPFPEKVNATPLFYRADRFELLDSGRRLFHEELDWSKGWNYGVFGSRSDGGTFAVFNTHFWWESNLRDEVLRRYNAMETVAEMRRVGAAFGATVFLMGDLNCKCDSLTWKYLRAQGWETSFLRTDHCSPYSSEHHDPVIHADGSCTGSTTDEPKEDSIDHIAVPASVEVLLQHAVIDREALDASDHSPVYADVEF